MVTRLIVPPKPPRFDPTKAVDNNFVPLTSEQVREQMRKQAKRRGQGNAIVRDYGSRDRNAGDLNNGATELAKLQGQWSGNNLLLPIIYGTVYVGAKIGGITTYNGDLFITAAWGYGLVDDIVTVYSNDLPLPGGIVWDKHLGSVVDTLPALWSSVFPAQQPIPGVVYSGIRVVVTSDIATAPKFAAIVRGRKVYDPRTSTTAYSDNPALCLADFLADGVVGMGKQVDWASVAALADINDTLIGGVRKRTMHLAVDKRMTGPAWVEILRTYAGCWVDEDGGKAVLIPDAPGVAVGTCADRDCLEDSIRIQNAGLSNRPNVVEVDYANTGVLPWRLDTVRVMTPDVQAGTVEPRISKVTLPGITDYNQAYREAIERLNKSTLLNTQVTLTTFDESLRYRIGAIIDVDLSLGGMQKPMRVIHAEARSDLNWNMALVDYDPAVYSTAVVTAPTYPDSRFQLPGRPPPATSLAMSEEIFQLNDGSWRSRMRVTWVRDTTYLAFENWSVVLDEVQAGGGVVQVFQGSSVTEEYVSPAVQEDRLYRFSVVMVNGIGQRSSSVSIELSALGKFLPPGDVPYLDAVEAGGIVFLSWGVAVDIDAPLLVYELRYGPVGVTWAAATRINILSSLAYTVYGTPAGTYDFLVKARDDVGLYSVNATRKQVRVTSDAGSITMLLHTFTAPVTLTNFAPVYTIAETWVTDRGELWKFGETNVDDTTTPWTSSWMNYPEPVPADVGNAVLLTEVWDSGLVLAATVGSQADVLVYTPPTAPLPGALAMEVGYSTDGTNFTYTTGGRVTARYYRVRVTVPANTAVRIGHVSVQLAIAPISETGVKAVSTGDRKVSMKNRYASITSITLTVQGSTGLTAVYDAIDLVSTPQTFDIYVFNSANAQVSANVSYFVNGV